LQQIISSFKNIETIFDDFACESRSISASEHSFVPSISVLRTARVKGREKKFKKIIKKVYVKLTKNFT